ncbi:YdcH family protein [Marinicella gelatinilytica]|uniref:YdcH family protein n=1 Tax=Marinicella gelatinilytica TaxID=2996017 RepID=UPI002260A113|nr:DUF465 domain-containing protein [Marinicella gelatinilytica]MCX7544966.1 DUF465 domain-containing protein [Marinicella gelatinilytica]
MALKEHQIKQRLEQLKEKHDALESRLIGLESAPEANELDIKRVKKEKLSLKDDIKHYEDMLIPDMDA